MATWKLVNVVATVSFNIKLPLDLIATKLENTRYDPEQFPGLVFRPDPKSRKTALIFNSGKINVTGAEGEEDVKEIVEKIREKLKEIGIDLPNKYEVKFQNFVVRGKFKYDSIDILRMAEEIDGAQYNPEQFPAVIVPYNKDNINVKFTVFSNGNFICAGLKDVKKVKEVVESFENEVLSKYSIK